MLRFEGLIPESYFLVYIKSFIFITIFDITVFYLFGLYKNLWRYTSIDELFQMIFAISVASVGNYVISFLLGMFFPRTIYILVFFLMILLVSGSRISYRLRKSLKISKKEIGKIKRIMIIGAGNAGALIIRELRKHRELMSEPVCIIDDDYSKHGLYIHGVPVVGERKSIVKMAEKMNVDEIIISMPSAKRTVITELINTCKETNCKLKTVPGFYELIGGKVSFSSIRDVNIEDLLGRDEVNLNTEEISSYLKGEVILITGAGGSIGSELTRQIAKFGPKKLLLFDIYENNVFDLQNELNYHYKNQIDFEILIGSIQDAERMDEIFKKYKPTVVFHAAAHKHVPLMEDNPMEAIKNNIFGTMNVAESADKHGTKRFVMISTDKAVKPTNIMGATKRMAEIIIQAMDKTSKTEFVAVRFGNVLGSNGSAVPFFLDQIRKGGPVTVTHPEITRYFMTIPEAAKLVIQSGAMANGGEIFILDMGEPIKIVDLVSDLISLSGLKPGVDIGIEFIGLRPGEKLYEELLLAEEGVGKTVHKSIFVAMPIDKDYKDIMQCVNQLRNTFDNSKKAKQLLRKIIPTYTYTSNNKIEE